MVAKVDGAEDGYGRFSAAEKTVQRETPLPLELFGDVNVALDNSPTSAAQQNADAIATLARPEQREADSGSRHVQPMGRRQPEPAGSFEAFGRLISASCVDNVSSPQQSSGTDTALAAWATGASNPSHDQFTPRSVNGGEGEALPKGTAPWAPAGDDIQHKDDGDFNGTPDTLGPPAEPFSSPGSRAEPAPMRQESGAFADSDGADDNSADPSGTAADLFASAGGDHLFDWGSPSQMPADPVAAADIFNSDFTAFGDIEVAATSSHDDVADFGGSAGTEEPPADDDYGAFAPSTTILALATSGTGGRVS